jgi:SOS-response transcriptional repressor LexA
VSDAIGGDAGCSGAEVFALRVLGDSMAPEFVEGDIVLVEPDGAVHDGSFVLADPGGEWIFRQLARAADGWTLRPLNPTYAEQPLSGLSAVRGVVIQKAVPGRRRLSKRYI